MKHKYIENSIINYLDYYCIVDGSCKELVNPRDVARGLIAHLEGDGYEIVEQKED